MSTETAYPVDRRAEREEPLLEIRDLAVTFFTPRGTVRAVREASLTVRRGEVVGLVGESGCGKSTVAFATMGYLPGTATVTGEMRFEGRDLTALSQAEWRRLRGSRIAMVYQDPGTSLNPTMRVGRQVAEVIREHRDASAEEAAQRTAELFESVGLPNPARIGRRFPHELSGGQQQRVVIAMALACDPDLLLMDEPTTGLDVTTEATILDLVADLKDRVNAGIIFVSHNLGVIARVADRVVVMYGGQTIEEAPVRDLFKNPQHPYTAGLLNCVPAPITHEGPAPRLRSIPGVVFPAREATPDACLFADRCPLVADRCREEAPPADAAPGRSTHPARCFFPQLVAGDIWGQAEPRIRRTKDHDEEPLLEVDGLHQYYGGARKKWIFFGPPVRRPVRAAVEVDFEVGHGHTLGIVGESGSGKSTVARSVTGLEARTAGDVRVEGESVAPRVSNRSAEEKAKLRMVFQNPYASLNPQISIGNALIRSIRRARKVSRRQADRLAGTLMEAVGLERDHMRRRPGELSGGQQQRAALASAFAAEPKLVVADEAVSSLDVSVQAQVLNLIARRQEREGTSFIFISHDLGVVRYISDDILVMYAGHVAESGPAESVLHPPSSPYTEALLSAAPTPDPDATPTPIRLEGAVPTLRRPFTGCFFADRCPRYLGDLCDDEAPPARTNPEAPGHVIHCHIPLDELTAAQLSGEAPEAAPRG